MIDRLDEIAYLSVLRDVLNDLDPDGPWQDDSLYLKWRHDRYSLSQGQFYHLIHALDTFRKRAEYQRFRAEINPCLKTESSTKFLMMAPVRTAVSQPIS